MVRRSQQRDVLRTATIAPLGARGEDPEENRQELGRRYEKTERDHAPRPSAIFVIDSVSITAFSAFSAHCWAK